MFGTTETWQTRMPTYISVTTLYALEHVNAALGCRSYAEHLERPGRLSVRMRYPRKPATERQGQPSVQLLWGSVPRPQSPWPHSTTRCRLEELLSPDKHCNVMHQCLITLRCNSRRCLDSCMTPYSVLIHADLRPRTYHEARLRCKPLGWDVSHKIFKRRVVQNIENKRWTLR